MYVHYCVFWQSLGLQWRWVKHSPYSWLSVLAPNILLSFSAQESRILIWPPKKKIRSSYYILKPYLSFMDCFSCFWRLPSFLPHHHQNAWHLIYSKCSINLWWHKWMNGRVQTINRDTLTVGEFFIIHLITVQEEPSIKWVLRKNKLYILFQQQVF